MTWRWTITLAFVLALSVTTVATATPMNSAVPTPPETGCPAAYDLLAVTFLESQGPYRLPRIVDEQGNNNGHICAKALSQGRRDVFCRDRDCPDIVYYFRDDDLPAKK